MAAALIMEDENSSLLTRKSLYVGLKENEPYSQFYKKFKKVQFKYNSGHNILKGINMTYYNETMSFLMKELNECCSFYRITYDVGMLGADNVRLIIYDPDKYPDKVWNEFNKLLKRAQKNKHNLITMDTASNRYEAMCIQRNMNKIFVGYYRFEINKRYYGNTEADFYYQVQTNLNIEY